MGKKDNEKRVATPDQRRLMSMITMARRHGREWDKYEDDRKEEIIGEVGTDITLVTESGAEVGAIVESLTGGIDWAAFRKANPHLEPEIKKYEKPKGTSVRILTQWVEPEHAPATVPDPS